jgi:hypothetical protein
MLKHNPNASAPKPAPKPVPKPQAQHQPMPPFPSYSPERPVHTGSSVHQWVTYADGGAKENDAAFLRKVEEEEARYAAVGFPKLVEVSPQKKNAGSLATNEHLLVDIDVDISPPKQQLAPPFAAGEENVRSSENLGLLD